MRMTLASRAVTTAALALALVAPSATAQARNWKVDAAKSRVEFRVRHLMVSDVVGTVDLVGGTIKGDPARPAAATIDVTLDPASIETGDESRDDHLRTADFLWVTKHPRITFVSKSVKAAKSGRLDVRGDLTLRGVTREIVLEVASVPRVSGNGPITLRATTTINRKDYGVNWNRALDGGGVVVADDVRISIVLVLNAGT